jgi:hypothetical protein
MLGSISLLACLFRVEGAMGGTEESTGEENNGVNGLSHAGQEEADGPN